MNISEIPTRYDASTVEPKWYDAWEKAGLFQPDADPAKPTYCITIPPPNITGSLHMGHALCYSLQDLFGRYRRMRGDSVLILPGQDHAGIATQSVVEKQLKKEGTSGAAIGRERFVERAWEWRRESGGTILEQLRLFGCAFDWTRSVFTLDPDYANTVLNVFIAWFERGLIYRGKRVINWDPVLQTSVSDIETLRETRRNKLYKVRYPFADGSGAIVIATTRPETMLADVAVAVHPSDARYKDLIGKLLILPILGREIPLIADPYPDPAFGTGAVKITPAHDANDYMVGVRHGLPMPVVLDGRARVTLAEVRESIRPENLPFAEGLEGVDRLEARQRILEYLRADGSLVAEEDYDVPIVISDRSGSVIEPLLSEQWFCDQKRLAEAVIERLGLSFHPARYDSVFREWLGNVREWCLSRQLWWGHRIPVYYDGDGQAYAALSAREAQVKAGGKTIVSQDEDVLDTWFSSGLWPFATLGWPRQTEDLERFYPTQLLITDRNIINLWIARMAMMGLDLTGRLPFSDVMVYATVLREDGRRMSKSLGTGIDPVEVIRSIGADALRYTLLSQTGENQDLRYSERRTEDARNFANKIWNATRFILLNAPETPPTPPHSLLAVDKWLLSRLARTETTVREAYDTFDIQSACQALYRFFWSELCDWYIEVSKSRLVSEADREAPTWVLITSMDAFLKMLHPIMPHLTEELYQYLPTHDKSPFLMSALWPNLDNLRTDASAELSVEQTFGLVRAARALRAEVGLTPGKSAPQLFVEGDFDDPEGILASQAWFQAVGSGKPSGPAVSAHSEGTVMYLPIEGVDVEKELARMDRDLQRVEEDLARVLQKLSNPQFVEKARPEVVEKERANADELRAQRDRLLERRALFST